MSSKRPEANIVIRPATASDGAELERLAQLEGVASPRGQIILAEQGTVALAAISLEDGQVVADPFQRTALVVAMLRLRHEGLAPADRTATSRLRALFARRAPVEATSGAC